MRGGLGTCDEGGLEMGRPDDFVLVLGHAVALAAGEDLLRSLLGAGDAGGGGRCRGHG